MVNKLFEQGTIIKGKQLKNIILCKILSEDMNMRGYQYKMGMNVDINQLSTIGSCGEGLHFCTITNIHHYLGYGTQLAIVSIPDDEDVYVDDGKFRTHKLNIDRIMPLCQVETWEYLLKNGADLTEKEQHAVMFAIEKGYLEILKFLHKNGLISSVSYAIRWYAVARAAENGHLDIVKYLHENGIDITAGNNRAIRWAAENGHLEVVKYLHENGADITAENNQAIRWATENGHLNVVKYLHENGADITESVKCAVMWAEYEGYNEVVQYFNEILNQKNKRK